MFSAVLKTERLQLRQISVDDAKFILKLLNEPSFIKNIGDKLVRTIDDARSYILSGPIASYARHGFGLNLVELRESGEAIGICGLLKRETLDDPDIGYAFLPEFWSRGYAVEAAAGVMQYANSTLGLSRVVAITSIDNASSVRVLEKIGFRFEKMISLSEDGPQVKLFVSAAR